ncbi:MAG: 30S ribosomal protein S16 [Candidatus Eisenbacteria bacterium]|nr:30S ribosomal protein S16 [Candidatus Eisenbacteria bacterium]
MAVVIRLQRAGGRNHPFYRVVATDSRAARDGRFLEKLGFYNPLTDPAELHLEVPRIRDWMGKGAHLSETVTKLLDRFEDEMGKKQQEGLQAGT